METRPTRTGRTTWLYFIPVLFFVLGIVFYTISNSGPYVPDAPITPMEYLVWTGAWVSFGLGILGAVISIGMYAWRARAAKTPQ